MHRTVVALAAVLAAVPLIAQPLQGEQSPHSGRRVAITIDDGPVVNEMSDLGNFQRITNGLIGSFQVEKVPVTIFVNEAQLNVPGQRDARAAVLDQWLDAGFELLGTVVLVTGIVALLACVSPAYRAARVDPLRVLSDQ